MIRYLYDFNGLFLCPYECQLDPLESATKGEPVYMIPANSTDIEPPATAEGETLRWVDGVWTVEKPPEELETDPDIVPTTTMEERLSALEAKNQALTLSNQMLEDCLVEMAGVVYG